MMTFIWMAIIGIGIMLVSTIGISLLSRSFMNRFPGTTPVYFMSGIVLTLLCLIIAIITSFQFSLSFLSLLALFISGWLLLWGELKLRGIRKEILYFLLCLMAPCLLPQNLPLFQQYSLFFTIPFLGISLYLIMRIFTLMDRVSNFSLLTLLTQGILLVLIFQEQKVPGSLLHALFYMFVVTISVSQTTKAFTGESVFGNYAASVSGFILGCLWIYILALGHYFMPLFTFSYDITELAIAGGITLISTHRLYPFSTPFFIERAQQTGFKPKKVNRLIFAILLMSALIPYLLLKSDNTNISAFTVQGVILFCSFVLLKNWGTPSPSFRDLASDLKNGLLELKEHVNHIPLKQEKSAEQPEAVEEAIPVKQVKSIKQAKPVNHSSKPRRSRKK